MIGRSECFTTRLVPKEIKKHQSFNLEFQLAPPDLVTMTMCQLTNVISQVYKQLKCHIPKTTVAISLCDQKVEASWLSKEVSCGWDKIWTCCPKGNGGIYAIHKPSPMLPILL